MSGWFRFCLSVPEFPNLFMLNGPSGPIGNLSLIEVAVWERFYNFDRPHGAHGGKMPYEALREKLSS